MPGWDGLETIWEPKMEIGGYKTQICELGKTFCDKVFQDCDLMATKRYDCAFLIAFDLGNVVTTDAPGVHAYFFGVGGSGRRPVSPPTPNGVRRGGQVRALWESPG